MLNKPLKKLTLLLVLFISLFSNAQDDVNVDLSNPKATVYTHIYFLQDNSYEPKKSARTIDGKKEVEAINIAININVHVLCNFFHKKWIFRELDIFQTRISRPKIN